MTEAPPTYGDQVTMGLLYNAEFAFEPLTMGPAADSEEVMCGCGGGCGL